MIKVKPLKQNFWFFSLVVGIAVIFRVWQASNLYTFELDQDLFSWIVKDILVNHHLRLIGQMSSIDGVFIGPLYYYLLVPFFFVFNMNPISALIPALLISIGTMFSVYFVFSKFYGRPVGTVGLLFYACSLPIVLIDRWIVPTQTTLLWSVWYLYSLLAIVRGDKRGLLVAAILIALIWHVHIALLPLALLVPVAIFLSKKRIPSKSYIQAFILFAIFNLPFLLFELRHNFQQVRGILAATTASEGDTLTFWRVNLILDSVAIEISRIFLYLIKLPTIFLVLVFGAVTLYLKRKKILNAKDIPLILIWIFLIAFSQFISGRTLSEYYFNNLMILSLLVFSLFFANFAKNIIAKLMFLLLLVVLVYHGFTSLNKLNTITTNGYSVKKQLVEAIVQDAKNNSYPCISVTYIAPLGSGFGFRYLMWYKGLNVINPTGGIPNYDVLIGWKEYDENVELKFGLYGLKMPPPESFSEDEKECSDPKNQLGPMLNFTD